MEQLILHENDFGGVSICYPTEETLQYYSVLEIALKDTPTGQAFWIVNDTELSKDYTYFNAWELDLEALGEPDGYGMDYDDWVKQIKEPKQKLIADEEP